MKMIPIMAIDPGTAESAVVVWDGKEIITHFKVKNEMVLDVIYANRAQRKIVIEMVASYGCPVGKTVFETVLWIGRFVQAAHPHDVDLIYRQDVKLHFCHQVRAKDAHIRQALIDRYGDKGTKANPGLTYGLKADEWQALALAVYAWDSQLAEEL